MGNRKSKNRGKDAGDSDHDEALDGEQNPNDSQAIQPSDDGPQIGKNETFGDMINVRETLLAGPRNPPPMQRFDLENDASDAVLRHQQQQQKNRSKSNEPGQQLQWSVFLSYFQECRKHDMEAVLAFFKQDEVLKYVRIQPSINEGDLAVIFASLPYLKDENCKKEAKSIYQSQKPYISVYLDKEDDLAANLDGDWFNRVGKTARSSLNYSSGVDETSFLQQLKDKILNILMPSPENQLKTIGVPFFDTSLYYERLDGIDDSLLNAICETCQNPEKGACLITGDCGIGKTTTISHIIYDPKCQEKIKETKIQAVVWLNCYAWLDTARRNSVIDAEDWLFAKIIGAFRQIDGNDVKVANLFEFARHLSQTQRKILFILDDVLDYKLALFFLSLQQQYLAPCVLISNDQNVLTKLKLNELVNRNVNFWPLQDHEIFTLMTRTFGLKKRLQNEEKRQKLSSGRISWGYPLIASLICHLFTEEMFLDSGSIFNKIIYYLEDVIPQKAGFSRDRFIRQSIYQFVSFQMECLNEMERRRFYALLFFDPGSIIEREDVSLLWGEKNGENVTAQFERFVRRGLVGYEGVEPEKQHILVHQMVYEAGRDYAIANHDQPLEMSAAGNQGSANFLAGFRFAIVDGYARNEQKTLQTNSDDEKIEGELGEDAILFDAFKQERLCFLKEIVAKLKPADLTRLFLKRRSKVTLIDVLTKKPETIGGETFFHFLFEKRCLDLVESLLVKMHTISAVGLLKQLATSQNVELTFIDHLLDAKLDESWHNVVKIMSPFYGPYLNRKWREAKLRKFKGWKFLESALVGKAEDMSNYYNPNLPFSYLVEAFLAAASRNSVEIVDFMTSRFPQLLEAVDHDDDDQGTVLHLAVKHGSLDVVRFLLNKRRELARLRAGPCEQPVLHVVQNGDVEMAGYLLKIYPALLSARNKEALLAIHLAAERGDRHLVALYARHQSQDGDYVRTAPAFQDNGKTAVHFASAEGHIGVLHDFIQTAGVEILHQMDDDERSGLHHAAAAGHLHIVRLFAEKAPSILWQSDKTGRTALHYASLKGCTRVVRYLIKKGLTNPRYLMFADHNQQTALHLAVAKHYLDVVEELTIAYQGVMAIEDQSGDTPMHLAILNGDMEIIQFFAEKSVKFVMRHQLLHYASQKGTKEQVKFLTETIAQKVGMAEMEQFLLSAVTLCLETIQILLEKCPGLWKNGAAGNLLLSAIKEGKMDLVRYLAEKKPDLVNHKDDENHTALQIAENAGHLEIFGFLTHVAAEISKPEYITKRLFEAAEIGDLETVRATEHSYYLSKNEVDLSPLDVAACKGNIEIVRHFLEIDKSLISKSFNHGSYAVQQAIVGGYVEIVHLLVDTFPEVTKIFPDPNSKQTLLHYAATKGQVDFVKYLLQKDPSLLLKTDRQDSSVLHCAAKRGDLETVRYLAEKAPGLVTQIDGQENTPFNLAILGGHFEIVRYFAQKNPTLLSRAGPTSGVTPLHLAAKKNETDIVRFLFEKDHCLIRQLDKANKSWTALHYAASTGSLDAICLLIEKDPGIVGLTDGNGMTAYQIAQQNGHFHVIFYFDENSESFPENFEPNYDDLAMFHVACRDGNKEAVQNFVSEVPYLMTTPDGLGITAIDYAALNDYVEIVCDLLELTDDQFLRQHEFSDGQNALHFATKAGRANLFLRLIDLDPILLIKSDFSGVAPCQLVSHPEISQHFSGVTLARSLEIFHDSARDGKTDLVRRIVDYNSKWLTFPEPARNLTVVDYAVSGGQIDILRYIFEKDNDAISKAKGGGAQAICDSAKENRFEIVQFLLEKKPELITATLPDREKWNVLHSAALGGKIQIVSLLAEKQPALIEELNDEGENAQQIAEKYGHAEVAAYLAGKMNLLPKTIVATNPTSINVLRGFFKAVKFGPVEAVENYLQQDGVHLVNAREFDSGENFTALHWAALADNEATAAVLIKHGADVNAVDDDGLTALQLVLQKGYNDFANLREITARHASLNTTPTPVSLERTHSSFVMGEIALSETPPP